MSVANPALLAMLFITGVTKQTDPDRVVVHLSDGSEHEFVGFSPAEANGVSAYRVTLAVPAAEGEPESSVDGPFLGTDSSAMFGGVGVETPELTGLTAPSDTPAGWPDEPPRDPMDGPTPEEIERDREIVERANAAAAEQLAKQAAAVAPKVEGEPPAPIDRSATHEERAAQVQGHVDRMHALLDVIERELHSGTQWAVREFRVIFGELGVEKSK